MRRIGKFHKVSFERFAGDWKDSFPEMKEEEVKAVYENLSLPRRATAGSAGYDFFAPVSYTIKPGANCEDPYWDPCGNGTGLGIEMLSKKRSWI